MTCQYDRDIQCFEDCEDCSRYKLEIPCPECDTITSRTVLNKYDNMCWDCFFEQMLNDDSRKTQFIKDHKDEYEEYIKELFG